ncbi:single-stranded-DNA-specific exonuclease RecJ [Reichenbachiella agariperforans]|uniref:single-stranded-DNA-specific exonuclease RecJ n=1 Tax=Reichenbachiella agariperforans TaxID=156994 RepID=UPI001C08F316|nr:single-stranded-DNA-specific exonuclease RecJ [Reichenbachiella agariperforans]MBU2914798.1 single-stranded-DNA-specific exonuclease RecJ [Reichenbachiella agariperforans]
MNKKWIIREKPSEEQINTLKESLGIDHTLCSLLVQRGINDFEIAKAFFRPSLSTSHDPFEMKNMSIAIERLTNAIFNNEKILIYGDYDVDGSTSVALVYNFLKSFSSNLFTYIPDRYTEGYGVSMKGIEWAIDHGVNLIITLDCGIRAVDTVQRAADNHIDTIICDHHLPGTILPPAIAVLDPKQADCTYPYKELSGCGIGYKLLEAFSIQNGVDENQLLQYLDLVAVSIACDIVPITGENRTLAYFGLRKLNSDAIPGLKALIKKSGMQLPLSISNVVFGLGPRINAAGRISHADAALNLLTQSSEEDAKVFAEKLNLENEERKSYDESITKEALALIQEDSLDKNTTVLFKKDWHKGIIGIVASRCIEHHYRPTIILTESNQKVTGSARSIEGFDVYAAIESCSSYLEQFGGHKYAAGLTMHKSNLVAFKDQFEKVVSAVITPEDKVLKIVIDAEIKLDQITTKFYSILNQMGPFGPGNMQPVFISRNIRLKSDARLLKEKHLKLAVYQEDSQVFDAIGFGMNDHQDTVSQSFDMVYTIEENNFRGNTSLQLMIKDLRVYDESSLI